MSSLADAVLPLIRTRADLHRRRDSNRQGAVMHEAIDILGAAADDADPVEVYAVTHKALTGAIKVIARADDSSGIIGDACRRLLDLHPRAAAAARTPPVRLVEWMIKFQFKGDVDYFDLDPVAYAPALGTAGMTSYRARLDKVRERVGVEPEDRLERLSSPLRHEHWVLSWNDRRLAVLDRDPDAIIRTHARDGRVAAWFHDTAVALAEIDRRDLAIDWARRGVDIGPIHQSQKCADLWCVLLAETPDRAGEVIQARRTVFDRWPTEPMAALLHKAATDSGKDWATLDSHVIEALLARSPDDAVGFVLHVLRDPSRAWRLAHDLDLHSTHTWASLVTAYDAVDPTATIPVHIRLVEAELAHADSRNYRNAARRLAHMRTLAAATADSNLVVQVDELVADLRHTHRRRPRLQREFDEARLA